MLKILIVFFIFFIVFYEVRNSKLQTEKRNFKLKNYQLSSNKIIEQKKWNNEIQNSTVLKDKNVIYTPNRKIKVLVGDYDKYTAIYTNTILQRMGIETEFVASSSDIIEKINNKEPFDLIITNNVYRDGNSGLDIIFYLRKNNIHIPTIILTAFKNEVEEWYKEFRIEEYIQKPLSEEKVMETFANIIPELKFYKKN